MRAARAETFATEYGSAARRLEGHGVGFAALIANDVVTLAVAASAAASACAAEVGAARVSASFATLGLAQVTLGVIVLLALCEGKVLAALGTGNVNVWHDALFLLGESEGLLMNVAFCSLSAPG
jgi:hypothetical protein